jgi:hypothetical protein
VSGGVLPDVIGRVVLHAPTDTPAVRLAARDRVGKLRLHSPGSSAREILIVRELTSYVGSAVEPAAVASLVVSVDAQLAHARRSAVPLDGRPVPPGARAVVASDLAQLLAQYVIDLNDGCDKRRWWWQVLSGRFGRESVATVLASHSREAPHVIADLVRRRREDILVRVDDAAAYRLMLAMAKAYQAPRLAAILSALDRGRAVAWSWLVSEPARSGTRERAQRPMSELVVVVAVELARDPVRVRGAAFARFVAVMAGAAPIAMDGFDAERSRSAHANPAADWQNAPHIPVDPDRAPWPELATEAPMRAEPVGARTGAPSSPMTRFEDRTREWGIGGPAAVRPGARRTPLEPVAGEVPISLPSPAGVAHAGPPPDAPPGDSSSVWLEPEPARELDPGGTVTQLGGVFFLVRVCNELGLPDVFEPDWQLASTLGAWGTLDLLARSLLPRGEGWEHDRMWEMLSDLGGGSPLERARAMPARVPAALPADWSQLHARVAGHPPALGLTLGAPARQGLHRWLGLVRPVVTGLLVERLGVTADDLAVAMLQRRARVTHDRTHVDVIFPLAEASVPVRRAGLDRDPGWVPELARVITFQFDDDAFDGGFP